MGGLLDLLTSTFADGSALMLAVLVFLAAAVLAYGMMAAMRVRGAVKRRAAGIGDAADGEMANEGGSLRQTSLKAAQRLLDYTAKHYGSGDQSDAKVLRQRLVRAGIFDPRAVGYFFASRIALSIGLALAA